MTTSKEKAFELKNAGYPQPIEPVFGQKYWHKEYGEMICIGFIYVTRPKISKPYNVSTPFYTFVFDNGNKVLRFFMDDLIESAAFAPTATEIMEQSQKEVGGFVFRYVLSFSGVWCLGTNASPATFKGENPADTCAEAYLYFKKILRLKA
jgi:hypothetical protein